jgi:hypothetical protein
MYFSLTFFSRCIPSSCTSTVTNIYSSCPASATTGIVKRDGLGCEAMARSCRVQIPEKQCTPEWQAKVQACIPSGCKTTLKEAFNACPAMAEAPVKESIGCKAAADSCRIYIGEQPCTAAWSEKVNGCIPAGCTNTLKTIHAQCSQESKRSVESTLGCQAIAKSCRFEIDAAPCSAEWQEKVKG